jgi:ankyrin repeat protein
MRENHPMEKNLRQEYERIVAKSTPTDVGLDYLVAIGNEDVEKVGTLFQQHPNFQFSWSKSALHIAVEAGKAKSVNVLLTKGVIICTEDYDGHSALDVAARKNMVEIASLILKSVDNDEKRREMSSKALSHAVSWGHGEVAEVAELLIDAGVDVTKEVIGQPLLVLAARSKYHLIIKLLITKGNIWS